jgi:hypothetical protein
MANVSIVIRNAAIIDHEDQLVPGMAMHPIVAIRLAESLLSSAVSALTWREEHD